MFKYSFIIGILLSLCVQSAHAAVVPKGVLGFGESAAQDNMQFINYTAPTTYVDRGNSIDVTAETAVIQWIAGVTAPTRDELLFGHLKNGGLLNIVRCIDNCDAAADWSAQLNIAGVSATQICDNTDGGCWKVFDIAYEQLSGDAIVFYGKAANDGILYYNIWNGTSWVGEASYTFKAASAVDTRFIRVVPKGLGMADYRTDEILIMLGDNSQELFAMIWDGSGFVSQTTLTTNGGTYVDQVRCVDGAWEGTTDSAVVVYCNGTSSTTPYDYKTWNGTSWDVTGTSVITFSNATPGKWVTVRAHRGSNRMCAAFLKNGNDFGWGIWKADGTTAGWTAGTQDTTIENDRIDGASCAWENNNAGVPFAIGISTDAGTSDISKYETWTQAGGFSGRTDMPGAMSDDGSQWLLYAAPNDDAIMAIASNIDAGLYTQRWSGTAWEANPTNHSFNLGDGANGARERGSFDWTYRYYSPWSRNWRFYSDITSNNPTVGLNSVAENVEPTNIAKKTFVRLRLQFTELGTLTQADSRKKLQYTTNCNPNTTGANVCTWVDVGNTADTSAVWRYATTAETCTSCTDGTAITTNRLTGTTQNGTYISSKDAVAGTLMDHTGLAKVEYDYPLKAENVTAGAIYYFRAYDVDQQFPLYRRQDTGTTDCLGTTCTYPSLQIKKNNGFFYWLQ